MNKLKAKFFLSGSLVLLLILCSFFVDKARVVKASNSKVITVTFATTPTTATVAKTPLKYNKDFAFSFETDDGSQDNYETGFKYMYGGTSLLDLDGTTGADVFGGLYFTDGSGRSQALSSHPFLGDFVWNSRNFATVPTPFSVVHPVSVTANQFSWAELLIAYNAGFNVVNHSWSHAAVSDLPLGRTYAYPDPHGTSVLDYDYEISQNEAEVASYGIPASLTLVPPTGDHGYIDPAFARGYKFIASESASFEYSSNPVITVTPPIDGMNVTNSVDLDHLFAYRKFYDDGRFIPNTAVNINTYLDDIAAKSRSTNKYWAIGFTHRTGGASGGLSYSNYSTLMNHLATTYGRAGDDSIWMAPAQEVYEYLGVKQNTGVTTNTVGNVMTITLDTSTVPSGYRRYALSMKVASNAQIQSISYAGGEFTAHSENLSTGLINVDWGAIFTANDFTRVETLVSTAESTRLQSSIDTATTYVNFLPASSEKNAFTTRLGNITVVGRRFLINLGLSTTGKVLDSVVGSPTNGLCWNNARVGKASNSDFPEKFSDALFDANSNCLTSNATNSSDIKVAQPLSTASNTMTIASAGGSYQFGQQGAQAATDGTGLYPNDKLQTGIVSYPAASGAQTPTALEIRYLDVTKSYRVILLGNTKHMGSPLGTSKTQGSFSVTGASGTTTTGTLQFRNNIGTTAALNTTISPTGSACSTGCATATFNSVMPVNNGSGLYPNVGVITINVTPLISGDSIVPINIIDISEVTPAKPAVSFTGSALRSQGTGLVDFDYNLTDDNSSLVDFPTYEYSNTGAFGGEQVAATPKSSDGTHSGVSNLTSSPTGVAHRFVWDAITDITGSEGTYYLRLLPHSPTQTGNYYQSSGVVLDFKNPVQSSITAATTSTTSEITWSTQENTFGLLEYGLTSSYTGSAGSLSTGVAVMSHDFAMSSLSSCTVYHYRVSSRDSVGNTTVSSDQTFQTAGCPDPVSSVTPGLYNSTQSVVLSAVGSSSIRYNIDSDYPVNCTSGTLYSGAISVSASQTIYARACDISNNSTTAIFSYTIDTTPPSTPVASPVAGLYNSTQSVTLSASGSDSIRYSMSGTPASCASDTLYSTAISISSTSTIYTRACDTAGNSSTAIFAYAIDTVAPSTPTVSVPAGLYNATQSVTLSATDFDFIRYSLDSSVSDCSSGTLYTTPVSISATHTINARACDNAGNSTTASFVYTIDTTPPNTLDSSPSAGLYNATQSVSLSAIGIDYIRYNIGSTVSDCSSGTLYNNLTPISISATSTIYMRACDNAGNSATANFVYTIDVTAPDSVITDPIEGIYGSTQSVTLSATGSNSIRYSMSDTPASCVSDTLYTTAISISSSSTIYTRACDTAGNSSTTSFTYTIDTTPPSTPVASPIAGLYNSTQSVTLSASGSSSIRYSMSGTPSSCASDTLYSTAISISSSSTIYTRACDTAGNSTTASFAYTIDTVAPSTPAVSVPAGLYNATQSVALSATDFDSIRYSTSSLPADCSSGTLYSSAISVSTTSTIYARACDTAGNSSTASFAYTIDTVAPSTPVANPVAGTYSSTRSVTLTTSGSDSIRYSTTIAPVDCSSGALYSNAITISETSTVYALACDTAGNYSSNVSFDYVIDSSIAPPVVVVEPVVVVVRRSSGSSSRAYTPSAAVNTIAPIINPNNTIKNNTDIPQTVPASNLNSTTSPQINSNSSSLLTNVVKIKKDLSVGSANNDVKVLQQFLVSQAKGPKAKELKSHGVTKNFGPLTKAALYEWQKTNGLKADGIFGPKTKSKMIEVLNK